MSVSTAQRGFPETEFRSRVERAQKKMEADEIDALLLMTEPDVRYFTGFLTQFWQSPTRPWFLLVPAQRKADCNHPRNWPAIHVTNLAG